MGAIFAEMKKIAIVGPESTGKTTLTARLAAHLGEPWVPEFARTYLEALGRPYHEEDLLEIARGQLLAEEQAGALASEYLLCDTNLLVIKVWMADKFGKVKPELEALWQPSDYALHLLMYPDLPWEPDPMREDPHRLQELFSRYEAILEEAGVSFAVVRGRGEDRFANALWAFRTATGNSQISPDREII